MGGGNQQQNPNVIIPDIGAAKYWYVDPRARDYQGMPVGHSDQEQAALYQNDPRRYSPPHEDQNSFPSDLVNRSNKQAEALIEALKRMGITREEATQPDQVENAFLNTRIGF